MSFDSSKEAAAEYHQGLVYLRAKNYVKAAATIKNAIEMDSSKGMYYYSLALCYMNMNDFFAARQFFVKGYQHDSKHPLLLLFSVLDEQQLSLIASESPLKGEIFYNAAEAVRKKRPDLFASFAKGNTADILTAIFSGQTDG